MCISEDIMREFSSIFSEEGRDLFYKRISELISGNGSICCAHTLKLSDPIVEILNNLKC